MAFRNYILRKKGVVLKALKEGINDNFAVLKQD
jgi:hypothetical protein